MKKRKNNTSSKEKKLVKTLTISTIIIALIFLSIHAFIDFFATDIFDLMVAQIEKKSAGVYLISYDHVKMDFFQRSIHVKNLVIDLDKEKLAKIEKKTTPPTTPPKVLLKTTIPGLKIEGISIIKLIFNRSIYLNRLALQGKETELFRLNESYQTEPLLNLAGISLSLSNINLTPYFSFEMGEVTLETPSFFSANGLYTLKTGRLHLVKSPSTSSISLRSFELLPRYEKYQFARTKGYQTDRIELKVDDIISHHIDFVDLFENQCFSSRLITIENPRLEIFRDKNVARRSHHTPKKFPQQMLREFKTKLSIDSIRISGGHFAYIEHAAHEKKTGEIFFEDINATLANLTNHPDLLKKGMAIELNASAKLMGKSLLKAGFTLPIHHRENSFTFSGSLDRMDMRVFNPVLLPNAHVKIKKGTIDKIEVAATCDNQLAKGKMRMYYRNLKISMLKVKKGGKYKRKGIKSFLANIIIRGNNPKPGKPLKVGRILYIRERPISFFAYIWQALLSGIKSSLGI